MRAVPVDRAHRPAALDGYGQFLACRFGRSAASCEVEAGERRHRENTSHVAVLPVQLTVRIRAILVIPVENPAGTST